MNADRKILISLVIFIIFIIGSLFFKESIVQEVKPTYSSYELRCENGYRFLVMGDMEAENLAEYIKSVTNETILCDRFLIAKYELKEVYNRGSGFE